MKRRDFIELGAAAVVLSVAGLGARLWSRASDLSRCTRTQRGKGVCGGQVQDVWTDESGRVAKEGPWRDSGIRCGMARVTREQQAFMDILSRRHLG